MSGGLLEAVEASFGANNDEPEELQDNGNDEHSSLITETLSRDIGVPEDHAANKKPRVEFSLVDDATAGSGASGAEASAHDPLDSSVGNVLINSTDILQFKYPWEKGYLARFFDDTKLPGCDPPRVAPGNRNLVEMHVEVDDSKVRQVTLKYVPKVTETCLAQRVVKSTDTLDFVEAKREQRTRIVTAWWKLLADELSHSAVGRKISVEATFDNLVEFACSVIDATFAVKSANTLQKRFYALKAYRDWCEANGKLTWLPMNERHAWEYVSWLSVSGAAPTKATSFMESCRFGWYALGIDGCDQIERSLRIRGLTAQLHCRKRPWRLADVLTVQEVCRLHDLLSDPNQAPADRIACGHMLHLLYGRARWSDLLHVCSKTRTASISNWMGEVTREREMLTSRQSSYL